MALRRRLRRIRKTGLVAHAYGQHSGEERPIAAHMAQLRRLSHLLASRCRRVNIVAGCDPTSRMKERCVLPCLREMDEAALRAACSREPFIIPRVSKAN